MGIVNDDGKECYVYTVVETTTKQVSQFHQNVNKHAVEVDLREIARKRLEILNG
jgi:hypothetical protein